MSAITLTLNGSQLSKDLAVALKHINNTTNGGKLSGLPQWMQDMIVSCPAVNLAKWVKRIR